MLVVSVAAYTGHLPLSDNFAWLATPAALVLLSVAALVEILAYYIPGVDNLLDTWRHPQPSSPARSFRRRSSPACRRW
jgi:antibiotic biosynthesis monooxygenase (ABM) superfamily enzyme